MLVKFTLNQLLTAEQDTFMNLYVHLHIVEGTYEVKSIEGLSQTTSLPVSFDLNHEAVKHLKDDLNMIQIKDGMFYISRHIMVTNRIESMRIVSEYL